MCNILAESFSGQDLNFIKWLSKFECSAEIRYIKHNPLHIQNNNRKQTRGQGAPNWLAINYTWFPIVQSIALPIKSDTIFVCLFLLRNRTRSNATTNCNVHLGFTWSIHCVRKYVPFRKKSDQKRNAIIIACWVFFMKFTGIEPWWM